MKTKDKQAEQRAKNIVFVSINTYSCLEINTALYHHKLAGFIFLHNFVLCYFLSSIHIYFLKKRNVYL